MTAGRATAGMGRGTAAWLLGAAAIGPFVALAAMPPQVHAAPADAFQPPADAMLLTRTLRRPLPDGHEVMAKRTYEVRFVAEGSGFRLDGRLLDVEVAAPPSLKALADIERSRLDTGMFPLHVDAAGTLLPSTAAPSTAEIRAAVEIVMAQLGHSRLPALDMLEAQAFVSQFQKRPATSQWPTDLFRPAQGRHSQSRAIPLPGAASGHITIEIDARTRGADGLLDRLSRTVTTDLDGDIRRTIEEWTLAPAGRS